jgi:hypothetical protein
MKSCNEFLNSYGCVFMPKNGFIIIVDHCKSKVSLNTFDFSHFQFKLLLLFCHYTLLQFEAY